MEKTSRGQEGLPQREVSTASDFFIVDNSDEHWKALEYLRQWCELSKSIDIATGYFEVGALLALEGAWQKVDHIRILIGAETSAQTVEVIAEALRRLEESAGEERSRDPFLFGLEGVVDAMRTGKIQVRVYRKRKFHAKAYITHGRLGVVGSAALVGSSNFTRPGLTQNVELNVRFSGVEVRDLQDWFDAYWAEAEEATADVLTVLKREVYPYTPFDIYAKALQVLSTNTDPSDLEWESSESRIYRHLAPYQREGYHGLKQKAALHGGAFLTDGVGLGKTWVGMMLAEYFAVREKKNVLILATKTGQDAVWAPLLERYMRNLTGDFTRIKVMAHTDLSRADALDQVAALSEKVDVVIIDEAHNFRNRGRMGDDPDEPRSRARRLQMITKGKLVFLLTATPINNSLFDFVHQFELWTGPASLSSDPGDAHFAPLGIASVSAHVSDLERTFLKAIEAEEATASGAHVEDLDGEATASAVVTMSDFERLLAASPLLPALVVQHSRQYAIESSRSAGEGVLFPEPAMPRVVPYTYTLPFGRLLDEVATAANRSHPLFTLPMYYALAYSRRPEVDRRKENRQRQVVSLIRTVFLKRFESSIAAFGGSCLDLAEKILDWLERNAHDDVVARDRARTWRANHERLFAEARRRFRPDLTETLPEILDEDDNDAELLEERDDLLDPKEFDLPAMREAAFEDLHQLIGFLDRAIDVGPEDDDKFRQLVRLLSGKPKSKGDETQVFDPAFATQKVIVFTEFADTARFLERQLRAAGVANVDRIDGSMKNDRLAMIQRFAPFYNGVDADERDRLEPLRVLISTDVLSEGVNLQDCALIINYDIHWNPVRLMQRIGRVDRRMDALIEDALKQAEPALRSTRGTIGIRNFLPPDELEVLIRLHQKVGIRVRRISKTVGIPGGRLLKEEDELDDVKVFESFLKDFYGDLSASERLRVRFLELLREDPSLEDRLRAMKTGVHSGMEGEQKGTFVCSVEPVPIIGSEGGVEGWTLDEGAPRWAFQSVATGALEDLDAIEAAIRCTPTTPRAPLRNWEPCSERLDEMRRERLAALRKEIQLPLEAPEPRRICWMEIV